MLEYRFFFFFFDFFFSRRGDGEGLSELRTDEGKIFFFACRVHHHQMHLFSHLSLFLFFFFFFRLRFFGGESESSESSNNLREQKASDLESRAEMKLGNQWKGNLMGKMQRF